MSDVLAVLGWLLLGVSLGGAGVLLAVKKVPGLWSRRDVSGSITSLVKSHFGKDNLGNITISERKFPFRVRADLQRDVRMSNWRCRAVAARDNAIN